jgi:heme exporter protein C
MRSIVWKWVLFIVMSVIIVITFVGDQDLPVVGQIMEVVQRPVWDQAANGWRPEPWPLFRIMIFHVPMSWVAVLAFIIATIYSIKTLRSNDPVHDLKAAAAAELGLIFATLATVTGSIWAKFEWNSYWNWDPRETSILILLLIYGAYFALRSAIWSAESRARLSAVYAILAFLTVPFLVFVVPRIVDSLHPAPIFDRRGKMQMDKELFTVFMSSLAAFSALFFWMMNLKVSLARHRERC